MECHTCKGQGLLGTGDFPLNLSGAVKTCDDCSGKGRETMPTEEKEVEQVSEEIVQDQDIQYPEVVDQHPEPEYIVEHIFNHVVEAPASVLE